MKKIEVFFILLIRKLVYVIKLIVITVTILISACHGEEKKQSASQLQAVDTLDKETNRKLPKASETRIVFPGGDNFQQGCELVQDQAEALLEEFHLEATTKERSRQIIAELDSLHLQWKQMDCQQVFGYMIPQIPRLPRQSKVKKPAPDKPVVK